MKKIGDQELLIEGNWFSEGGKLEADPNCQRISALIKEHLQKIGAASSGFEVLYRDPEDGRYWELTYPHYDWHGGGPPTLRHLSGAEAKAKYAI